MIDIRTVAFGSEEYNATVTFRDDLLRRPLGLRMSEHDLAGEDRQLHVAAMEGSRVVGCIVLKPISDDSIKLRQMAVHPDLRAHGLGSRILREAEALALEKGYRAVEIHSRTVAVDFYLRNGYAVVGEEFEEVTIPHVKMTKKL